MTQWKSILIGLATALSAFALFLVMALLAQFAQPYIKQKGDGASAPGWGVAFTPIQFLCLILVVFSIAAAWEYRRLRSRNRNPR